jgi:4-hydroxybenzoate polyprenyltransferase
LPPHISHVLQPLDVGVFSSLKEAYRKEAGLINLYTNDTLNGKHLFLHCYQKARLAGLEESHILSGWRGTGLWPVNVAKPLMSRLLVENTNTTTSTTNLSAAMRIRGSHLASQDSIIARNYALATPLVSREVRAALKDFDPQKHSTTTQRILFRKVSKAYDEKDWQLGNALRENQKLKSQLEATRPTKRRKVETSPNSRFVTIRAIRRAQIEAGAIEAESADEEGSENTIEEEDCIVVGGSSSSDDDEAEG